jgi:hypothetical protein
MAYPSGIEIGRHNSVFLGKDKQSYKTEKLTTSINAPYMPPKQESDAEDVVSSKKIYDVIEKKNQEIQ